MAISQLHGRQAVAGGTRLPSISHSLLNVSLLQQHFLDASSLHLSTFQASSIRHILLDISDTLTPSNPRYPCAIHWTTAGTQATSKKPPPRRIGQEATAAPHRARSHRRAASGKKPQTPPLCSIGQEATTTLHLARSHHRTASGKKPPPRRLLLAAFDPRPPDFQIHPLYLPSTLDIQIHSFEPTHKFEFQLFVSTIMI